MTKNSAPRAGASAKACRSHGADAPRTVPVEDGMAPLPTGPDLDAVLARPCRSETLFRVVTRCTDFSVALAILVMSLPVTLLAALAIKLDSPGPVFYRGRRAKLNRRRPRAQPWTGPERRREPRYAQEFFVYKFRTMRADAAQRFPELYAYEHTQEQLRTLPMKDLKAAPSGPNAAVAHRIGTDDDPRLTRFGRWLRRTSVDEIPNLINVLRGEMSLVGGRPEEPALIKHYLPEHRRKFDLKPGVTGLAQVQGRGNLTFHEINAYDALYVDHHSLHLYFWILWRTAKVVATGEGAY